MELVPALDTRTHLFIVDAIHQEDLTPGGMISVDLSRSPGYFRNKISPHQLGLSEVLAAAEMNDALPGHITLFGIRPQSLETGLQLSEQAKLGLEEAVQAIVASLHALGIQPRPRE
jgi:hydrogenase maturation protease